MRRLWGHISTRWQFASAALLSILAGFNLDPAIFEDVTSELISFFSIQAASVLPAMIFTVGILKSEGITLVDVDRYHVALRRQLIFWITLLAFDFAAVAFLILGKIHDWKLTFEFTRVNFFHDATWIIAFGITLFGSMAALRTFSAMRGMISLLNLNSELTKNAIIERNRVGFDDLERKVALTPFETPDDFGRITDEP